MTSHTQIFGVQDDLEVNLQCSPLPFTKARTKQLYIITTHRSNAEQDGDGGAATKTFHSGVCYTVWTVAGEDWELRLILHPGEISAMFSSFNLIAFIHSLLKAEQLQEKLKMLLKNKLPKEKKAILNQVSKMAANFLSSPTDLTTAFINKLSSSFQKKWDAYSSLCSNLTGSVGTTLCVGLVAVITAVVSRAFMKEFAHDNSDSEDDEEPEDSEVSVEDAVKNDPGNTADGSIEQEFSELKRNFEIEEQLCCLSRCQKNVYVVFKENLSKDWSVPWTEDPKCTATGETLHYGICHKVLCVSSGDWEVQLLQSLNENFAIFTIFNLSGFANSLLMTNKWKTKLKLLLENNKQKRKTIKQVSQLAARFLCTTDDRRASFTDRLEVSLLEKCKEQGSIFCRSASDAGETLFGTLLVITAVFLAKTFGVEQPKEMTASNVGPAACAEVTEHCDRVAALGDGNEMVHRDDMEGTSGERKIEDTEMGERLADTGNEQSVDDIRSEGKEDENNESAVKVETDNGHPSGTDSHGCDSQDGIFSASGAEGACDDSEEDARFGMDGEHGEHNSASQEGSPEDMCKDGTTKEGRLGGIGEDGGDTGDVCAPRGSSTSKSINQEPNEHRILEVAAGGGTSRVGGIAAIGTAVVAGAAAVAGIVVAGSGVTAAGSVAAAAGSVTAAAGSVAAAAGSVAANAGSVTAAAGSVTAAAGSVATAAECSNAAAATVNTAAKAVSSASSTTAVGAASGGAANAVVTTTAAASGALGTASTVAGAASFGAFGLVGSFIAGTVVGTFLLLSCGILLAYARLKALYKYVCGRIAHLCGAWKDICRNVLLWFLEVHQWILNNWPLVVCFLVVLVGVLVWFMIDMQE